MKHQFHHEFQSCPSEMAEVRAKLRQSAQSFGFDEDTVNHLVLAADEACTNIIRHAYKNARKGIIEVDIFASSNAWEIRLRDYGKKCDPQKLKGRPLHEIRPGGLGLHFIRNAFDEVRFDHSFKKGTCLFLLKRKSR